MITQWSNYKGAVLDKWKEEWLKSHENSIGEYSWNYLFEGGKQIRPTLFCELWHYLSPDSKINTELAFAIECIHVASLVLDDLPWMDNASERRGKKTIHVVTSTNHAFLIAYEVLHMCIKIWKENCPNHVNQTVWDDLFKDKMKRLTLGQVYDLRRTGSLIEAASLKTGVLFELVTETVALCLDLDSRYWRFWGNYIGILFQWVDDWHDMDDDKLVGSRNAFNESYNATLKKYSFLWREVQKGIGQQWFNLDFGKFMNRYFTDSVHIISVDNENNDNSHIEVINGANISDIQDIRLPLELQTDIQELINHTSQLDYEIKNIIRVAEYDSSHMTIKCNAIFMLLSHIYDNIPKKYLPKNVLATAQISNIFFNLLGPYNNLK